MHAGGTHVVTEDLAQFVLLHAADDFGVQPFLERQDCREPMLPIGVFRAQMGEHLRVLALVVAQPVVGIDAHAVR